MALVVHCYEDRFFLSSRCLVGDYHVFCFQGNGGLRCREDCDWETRQVLVGWWKKQPAKEQLLRDPAVTQCQQAFPQSARQVFPVLPCAPDLGAGLYHYYEASEAGLHLEADHHQKDNNLKERSRFKFPALLSSTQNIYFSILVDNLYPGVTISILNMDNNRTF